MAAMLSGEVGATGRMSWRARKDILRIAKECHESKPGDNRRYDKLFGEGTE